MVAFADNSLQDAFHRTLREVRFTEQLAGRVHGRVARKASCEHLRHMLLSQQNEGAHRMYRLNQVFGMIGKSARAETCGDIRDMTLELESYLRQAEPEQPADALLICWERQIEAYLLGRYGTLKDWSGKLGLSAAEDMMDETLQDVRRAAARFENVVNPMAA